MDSRGLLLCSLLLGGLIGGDYRCSSCSIRPLPKKRQRSNGNEKSNEKTGSVSVKQAQLNKDSNT